MSTTDGLKQNLFFPVGRPLTAASRIRAAKKADEDAHKHVSAGVAESWSQRDGNSHLTDGAAIELERSERQAIDAIVAAEGVAALVNRQRDRWRAKDRPPSAKLTEEEIERRTREFHLKEGWKFTESAWEQKHTIGRTPIEVLQSTLPASVYRLTPDRRRVREPSVLHADVQRTLNHANTRVNDSALQAEWQSKHGEIVSNVSLGDGGTIHGGERAMITNSSSSYKGDEKEDWAIQPHSGLAEMLSEDRASHHKRADEAHKAINRLRPSTAPMKQREHIRSMSANDSGPGGPASLMSKLDGLHVLLHAARSRPASSAAHTTVQNTPASFSPMHDRAISRASNRSSGKSTPEKTQSATRETTHDALPIQLLDLQHVSVQDWIRLLGFASIRGIHRLLTSYVHSVRDADADVGVLLKEFEWTQWMEEFTKLELKPLIKLFVQAIALTLADYQTEATENEQQLNNMLALDPLANRVRASNTLGVNIRADLRSGRFLAHVFTHLHHLHGIPGPRPTIKAMEARLSNGQAASARAGSSAAGGASSRPLSAHIAESRHQRLVRRQSRPKAMRTVSRPLTAPATRPKNLPPRVPVVVENSMSHTSSTSSIFTHRSLADSSVPPSVVHSLAPSTQPSRSVSKTSIRPVSAMIRSAVHGPAVVSMTGNEPMKKRPTSAILQPAIHSASSGLAQRPSTATARPPTHRSSPIALHAAIEGPAAPAAASKHAHVPLSSFTSPAQAPALLHQLNTLATNPKLALAFPSDLSADAWQQTHLSEHEFYQHPAQLAITKAIESHREEDTQTLEMQRDMMQGHVAAVAQRLNERAVELKQLDETMARDRVSAREALESDRLQRALVFDRLDEEYSDALRQDEWIIRRTRVEEEHFALHFPTHIIQAVDFQGKQTEAASSPRKRASTATSAAPSSPLALSPRRVDSTATAPLVSASRPTAERFMPASVLAKEPGPRLLPYSSQSSTAPEIFPSFRNVEFKLRQFKLPNKLSPSMPYQHFEELPIELRPALCVLEPTDLRTFSHPTMDMPSYMGIDEILDEYFDYSTVKARRSSGGSGSGAQSSINPPIDFGLSLPRLGIDFGLVTRMVLESHKEEIAEEDRQRRREKQMDKQIEKEMGVKMEQARKKAQAAAIATIDATASEAMKYALPTLPKQLSLFSSSAAIANLVSDIFGDVAGQFGSTQQRWTQVAAQDEVDAINRAARARRDRSFARHDRETGTSGDEEDGGELDSCTPDSESEETDPDAAYLALGLHEPHPNNGSERWLPAPKPVTAVHFHSTNVDGTTLVDYVSTFHNRLHADLSIPMTDATLGAGMRSFSMLDQVSPSANFVVDPVFAQHQKEQERLRAIQLQHLSKASKLYSRKSANRRAQKQLTPVESMRLTERLQDRLLSLWKQLNLTSHDMLAMLEKYASRKHAAKLKDALPAWERCAALWQARSEYLALHHSQVLQSPHARDIGRTVLHGGGGSDEHANVLALTLQAAHACWTLLVETGDWIQVQGQPMILQLLLSINWDCCTLAKQVRDEIQEIYDDMCRLVEKRNNQDGMTDANHSPEILPISSPTDSPESTDPSHAPISSDLIVQASGFGPRPSQSTSSVDHLFHHPPSVTNSFVKPGLHPRPVVLGEFMTLIRGASVFQLPQAEVKVEEAKQSTDSMLKMRQNTKAPSRPRTATIRPPIASARRAAAASTTAALASQFQRRINNPQFNLFL